MSKRTPFPLSPEEKAILAPPAPSERERIAGIYKLAAACDASQSDVDFCIRRGLTPEAAAEHFEYVNLNRLAADPTSRIGAKIRAMRALREKTT